jgi:ABC transport system ATP-binding/permease protein
LRLGSTATMVLAMSTLIACQEISKTYWDRPLFESISLNINEGERIGIIGANGSGKTTLLRILADLASPDSGERIAAKGMRIGYVPQDSLFEPDQTVEQVVLAAAIQTSLFSDEDENDQRVRTAKLLSQLGFENPRQNVESLSGGWRKRLSIARALVAEPEILLLDEPTNHLDLEGILWLENLLIGSRFAYLVVSHDRALLQRVANRVIELDRRYPGGYLSVDGDYSTFLEKREGLLIARTKQQESLSNKVRHEIAWLRSGVKARTSKSKARIDEAHRLIDEEETMERQSETGRARIDFVATGRRTKRLLEAHSIGKSLGGRRLFEDFKLLLRPGMRLGLVGANGSGKTTLLRMLAEELDPDEGRIQRVDHLRLVYFDQYREQLDPELSLRQALSEKGDTVIFRDRPVHVGGWADRFRFRTEQLDVKIGRMSGGERAKILIARLMLKPADILLLDEPTNDLDIPTLEVLEESLSDFPGAVVLVTHDRFLLDRISTTLLELDGRGGAEYFADYAQVESAIEERKRPAKPKKQKDPRKSKPGTAPKKLTLSEQKEYAGLEAAIDQATATVERIQGEMEDPAIASDAEKLENSFQAHKDAQAQLEALYSRWYELESKQTAFLESRGK